MLAVLLALASQQPQLSVRADRDQVMVGGRVTITIIVTASGTDPVGIEDPELQGLEIVDQRQQTRVSIQGGRPQRITTREWVLRAIQVGRARVGPIRVRQGGEAVESQATAITVSAPAAGLPVALGARVEDLVARVRPPPLQANEVGLTVLRSADSVIVGEQLDLVVVAWFPRELRTQLRNPPVLSGPEVRAAWVYLGVPPTAAAQSRFVNGRWYDLFVLPEVVFPLTPGEIEIGEASVSFSVPVSGSFLSRELRREVRSGPVRVGVGELPPTDDRSAFNGAIGRDLRLRVDASSRELHRGDAARVMVEIAGIGNVSLWPEPALEWPVGLRAYGQGVAVNVAPDLGIVGGSKTYEYLVIADSVGEYHVPTARYTYFDTGLGRYVDVTATSLDFVAPVAEGSTTGPLRTPQPILLGGRARLSAWILSLRPLWLWVILVALPPLVALLWRLRRKPTSHRPERGRLKRRGPRASPLAELDAEYWRVVARLVPQAESESGSGLADALRAAGVDASLAAHAARVRERLRQARYGPDGGTDAAELAAEVQEVLRALGGGPGSTTALRAGAAAILVALIGAALAVGQAPEQLYEAGAVRLAADSFRTRATQHPLVAEHWHNLGNAFDYLGEAARARAAWIRATRLAPRARAMRGALERHPSPDIASDRLTWVSPVTPSEALVGALACWVLAWLLVAGGARSRYAATLLIAAVALGGYGGYVSRRYAAPTALVLGSQTPLRAAPYGSAPAPIELDAAAAVRIERQWGPWRLVSHGNARGWVLASEVTAL